AGQQQLDMAKTAFDDQYVDCVDKMERIAPRLLEEDMRMNKKLKVKWESAKKHWKQIKNTVSYPSQFNNFHGTALVAYTGSIAFAFNRAVRNFASNNDTFYFKGFHYYLTRALQLLNSGTCYMVYRGSKIRFTYRGKGNVRFGQFASSSLERNIAMHFLGENGTLFIINTCKGVHIEAFSQYPDQKEVLIPGYEEYQKVTINKKPQEKYNTIMLEKPQTMKSNFNCFYKDHDSNFNRVGRKKPRIPLAADWDSAPVAASPY
ncbi:T-cell ecto-ADP-ribosyltransferase 2-like, partial [Ochotona princeps]|uniref:T-cell ecto-ADP-ribosyltransferase 2-like n=1 Tax=Ochotona princeps TaxID=9978 RepID=UPI002714DAAD